MKGYVKNKVLYIFPQTADAIPYVDPSVEAIAVQEENIAAWKKANAEYADIIVKYNYNTITVNPKVWAGHTNDDIVVPTPPTPTTYDITLTGGDVATYVDAPASAEAGETVTITMALGDEDKFDGTTLTSADVEITKGADSWTFTMPAKNVTIAVDYHIPAYTITVTGDDEYVDVPGSTGIVGDEIIIMPALDYEEYFDNVTLTSSEVEITKDDGSWSFTMPAEDVNITVTYTPSYTITVTGDYGYVDAPASAQEDATVTITMASGEEDKFEDTTLESQEVEITKGADSWTFTMPAENVSIIASYTAPSYDINYTGDTEYVVTDQSSMAEGGEVTIYPAEGYEQYFSNVTLASSEVEITKGADSWTFTMPAEDVSITVTYTA